LRRQRRVRLRGAVGGCGVGARRSPEGVGGGGGFLVFFFFFFFLI